MTASHAAEAAPDIPPFIMDTSRPVYLDHAATTPVDPQVIARMQACLGQAGVFANPASVSHAPGRAAAREVEWARQQLAALTRADPRELVWTSGATEAINLAVLGGARFLAGQGRHVVTTAIEHRATLDACRALEAEGFDVSRVDCGDDGCVSPAALAAALRSDTVLVSVMHVNNETGAIQDIHGITEVCQDAGVALHVDAAQSLGKLPIDLSSLPVAMMSFSAHKLYGPKGIGALFLRRRPRARVAPLMFGGGHERGLRPGTLATHQIVGMGEAARIAMQEVDREQAHLAELTERLWRGLESRVGGVSVNGDPARRVPGIINLHVAGIDGEALVAGVPDVAFALGSACTSASTEPSHVLRAMGHDEQHIRASLRFSPGRFTTLTEIDHAVDVLVAEICRLRQLSPLWPQHGQQACSE